MAALGRVISSLETPELAADLVGLLECVTGYERAVFVIYFKSGQAVPIYSNLSGEAARITLDPYFDGAYLLDPWYNMVLADAPDGVYRLANCAPDDFTGSEYYREYYAHLGLEDECAVFLWLSDQACLVLSMGTGEGRSAAPDGPARMSELLPCLRPLCTRHWQGVTPEHVTGPQSIEELCVQMGLSDREVQVTAMFLRGYSNKIIANHLDISTETVKVYRKRINKKLGTSSVREVFARFFPAA